MMIFRKILAISPHTDDIELSCGGSLIKFISNDAEVHYIALSDCQDALLNTPFKKNTHARECRNVLKILGVKEENIYIHHHKVKFFFQESRKIFERLEKLREKIKPELVIIPSPAETHEDHYVAARQSLIAFRRSTSILAYEQPWNNLSSTSNLLVSLTEEELELKLKALQEFKTQKYFKRSYFDEDFIRGWARTCGIKINQKYAEAFEVIKLIG